MLPTPEELDAFLAVLKKHEVTDYQCDQFKLRIAQVKVTTTGPDISSGPMKTPEQIAEEDLYWSTKR